MFFRRLSPLHRTASISRRTPRLVRNGAFADGAFHLDPTRRRSVITSVTTQNMVLELKLRKVGNSVGVVLPKEALARLNSGEGGTLVLTDAPDGSFRLASDQSDFGQQMKAAEDIIRRYRNTLRELAK
jgi:putative addiction module antidote